MQTPTPEQPEAPGPRPGSPLPGPRPGPRPGPPGFPKPGPSNVPATAAVNSEAGGNRQSSTDADPSEQHGTPQEQQTQAPEQQTQSPEQQSGSPEPTVTTRGKGATGNDQVDTALTALDDLEDDDLANHHDRLAAAHEELHRALSQARPDQG